MVKPLPRLRLQGFNNLTKSLSFNIYDICYAISDEQRGRYIEYIDEAYNADRLTQILTDVAEIIGANILNVARQDYDPQGASVTILISEEPIIDRKDVGSEAISGRLVTGAPASRTRVKTALRIRSRAWSVTAAAPARAEHHGSKEEGPARQRPCG